MAKSVEKSAAVEIGSPEFLALSAQEKKKIVTKITSTSEYFNDFGDKGEKCEPQDGLLAVIRFADEGGDFQLANHPSTPENVIRFFANYGFTAWTRAFVGAPLRKLKEAAFENNIKNNPEWDGKFSAEQLASFNALINEREEEFQRLLSGDFTPKKVERVKKEKGPNWEMLARAVLDTNLNPSLISEAQALVWVKSKVVLKSTGEQKYTYGEMILTNNSPRWSATVKVYNELVKPKIEVDENELDF